MKTRKQATDFGLTFENTYLDTPFKDTNWQLIRVKGSKKAFLWCTNNILFCGWFCNFSLCCNCYSDDECSQ